MSSYARFKAPKNLDDKKQIALMDDFNNGKLKLDKNKDSATSSFTFVLEQQLQWSSNPTWLARDT